MSSHSVGPSLTGVLSYLVNALDAVDAVVLVYDAEECFVACNKRCREFFSEASSLFTPGRSLEEIARGYYRAGGRLVRPGVSEEEYVGGTLKRVREHPLARSVVHWGSRWMRLARYPTSDGGAICLAHDITEEKEIEHELRLYQRIALDLAELSYDWCWRQDTQLRFVEFSGDIERYLNPAGESWYGKQHWELAIEGVSDEQWAVHRTALAARKPFYDFEYRISTAVGRRWFSVSGKPLHDERGNFIGYHGVGRDITERKRAEEHLRESEARFRSLTELSSDWYWEQDEHLRFTYFSDPTNARSGYSQQRAIGKLRWDLPDMTPLSCSWEEHQAWLLARRPFRDFQFRRKGEDGFAHYVSISGTPVFGEDGTFRGYRGVGHDITERTVSEKRLREDEERFRALVQMSSDWYWEQDAHFRFTRFEASDSYSEFDFNVHLGKARWEVPAICIEEATWAAHRAELDAHLPFDDFEYELRLTTGTQRWVSISGRPLFDDTGRFIGYHGVGQDITQRKLAQDQLRESEERFRALTELSSDWYWEQDEHFRFIRTSRSVEDSGLSSPRGMTRWELPLYDVSEEQWREHRATLEAHLPFRDFTYRTRNKDGRDRWLSVSGEPVFDKQGRFAGYHGVGRDITERVVAEREIKRLAQFDFLTDLPNRTLFNDRLQQAITAAGRNGGRHFALLFIDLDHFRDVNNSLGHNAGDEILCEIARRFVRCLRSCDTVCRQGGDEFLVLVPLIDDATGPARLAKRLLEETAKPFALREAADVSITASIGIALYPDDGADAATLIKNADAAMYHTKSSGRNGYHFFTPAMQEQVTQRLALERRLREAVHHQRMTLYYQPQVDLRTGAITGAEALMRWHDEELGEVKPAHFIPLAEETRLIVPLGAWALGEACRQCRTWQTRNLPPVRICVNISPVQFQRADIVQLVQHVLSDTRLAPSLLEIEITEAVLLSDAPTVQRQLGALSDMGVRLALDDFGIGHTSLQHLKHLKVDRLKLDRTFFSEIVHDPIDASVTAAVIGLGRTLGLRVLAEGVETLEQRTLLAQLGCHEAQGHALSEPVTVEAMEALLARGRLFARKDER